MTTPDNSDYELLTEHFGYPPVALLDDIINTVNVLADRALESVERVLLSVDPQKLGFSKKHASSSKDGASSLPPEEAAKLEIEHGTHQLETLLNASIDKNFDLFELYTMRNILTVRPVDQPYMRLAHYEGLDLAGLEGPQAQDRPTTESVTALRRRLHASQRLHAALEAERARNDALLVKLRGALGVVPGSVKAEEGQGADGSPFGFLRDKASLQDAGADTPIATTTEFTLSQLQALRALSTSLRTLLPDLGPTDADTEAAAEDDASNGSRTWRRDRVEYVEGASRKYLETARGLELGTQGEVRDGEWQGEGRKITRSDVEGLEQVVAILGKGSPQTGDGDAMDESQG
ncbi:Kinetochore-associated MTW1 [Fusarium albosuccineum]|uniref:Kinetochore-associated MTW1 n=1 Tax=Fusarium albosuccineum TaxID=1237068 RepID=A0A8H4P4L1_9HYPO|nr:Kinetochore-associated MTW1 [Fusarium albosuccineum]